MNGTAHQPAAAEPAARVLRRLLAEHGYSSRSLATATKEHDGKGVSASYIRNVARGDDTASAEALRVLAETMGEPPSVFAEYRLALARRLFDEREVGLDEALANLSQLDAALAAASAAALDSAAAREAHHASRSPAEPPPTQARSPRAAKDSA